MSSEKLARSTGIVGLAVMGSRILGVVREQIFAGLFGAGRELDAFVTAFRIPNLFRDLFAEGALSAAFVTTFAQKRETDGDEAAWRLVNLVLHALLLVAGLVVALGMIFTPELVDLIAPGFAEVPGKTELTVQLTRVLFPFLLFIAMAALAMGVLNSRNQFGVAASASIFFNLGSIFIGLLGVWWMAPGYWQGVLQGDWVTTGPEASRAMTGMACGTLVGGALQFLVQVPSVFRVGFRYRPILSFSDPGVRAVLRLMGPATLGAAAVQVNVLVNNNFASGLGDGAVSWLNVAFRFMQLPLGVFGVAVGVVALPAVSRRVAHADLAGMRSMLVRALRLVLSLCLPAAAGLAVLAPDMIGLVYQHGKFDAHDTQMAASALMAYALGLAGYANIKVLVPAFYALGDARTPALISCGSILINAALGWTAIHVLGLGHVSLALATSVVACSNFALLFVILSRRVGKLEGLTSSLVPIAGGTLVVALIAAGSRSIGGMWLTEGEFLTRLVIVGLAVPGAALGFALSSAALGLRETRDLLLWAQRRLPRSGNGAGG
ncbi:murein biosynthesis integral membrane protein MurJ [Candidatus Binatia bacterium]|nr:murein biosynthesis integral membrane protein MurJ [Candidatus Binatia bacterium]